MIGKIASGTDDNFFASNSASYGKDRSSYPTSIVMNTGRRLNNAITDATPGQIMPEFKIELTDTFEQVVNNDDSTKATLAINEDLRDEDCAI
mmetsp:Transcript_26849/g.4888  ORF Transcript_26849/g.4888 Transcript_26849/m.4888 type:complete len:92 (-) Transcript_26849:1809-2084(-)